MHEQNPAPYFLFDVICRDASGSKKWHERVHNLVTTGGKSDLVTQYFTGVNYTAAWYMGLLGAGSISASDTLASHAGWQEVHLYSGTRPAIVFGAASSGSSAANTVNFAISGIATVAGAFITNASSGTGGVLYSAANFTNLRSVAGGDTLSVTPTVNVS